MAKTLLTQEIISNGVQDEWWVSNGAGWDRYHLIPAGSLPIAEYIAGVAKGEIRLTSGRMYRKIKTYVQK